MIGPPWKLNALTRLNKGFDVFWIESDDCSTSAKRSSILDFDCSLFISSDDKYWLADTKNSEKSSFLKVSQNSNCAVLCKRFWILSISFAPGSSIKILPDEPNLWILGWVTPNLSIRFLKTSNAETID